MSNDRLVKVKEEPDHLMLSLREDFRHHLEQFYACLHLAPPYDSIEKAIRFLSTSVQKKTQEEREQLAQGHPVKWTLFEQAFYESGLPNKHRGIIRGLVQSNAYTNLPNEYLAFTKFYLPNA